MFQDGVKSSISSTSQTTTASSCPAATGNVKQAKCTKNTPERVNKHAPSQHWRPSVPSQQFQALFNSLFKVLFIFPSQYLFAIGLPPVFSLRWNLPPALSCSPKQLDSATRPTSATPKRQTGLSPSLIPCSKGFTPGVPQGTHATTPEGLATWALPSSVALTEGILVSFFSSP